MPEATGAQEPPTYFANVVTSMLNVDGMTMEFRQYLPLHKELFKAPTSELVVWIPPATAEDLYNVQPVARVVLTFTAVRQLKAYLDQALPRMETARTAGQ